MRAKQVSRGAPRGGQDSKDSQIESVPGAVPCQCLCCQRANNRSEGGVCLQFLVQDAR